jgi:hypothetical protein
MCSTPSSASTCSPILQIPALVMRASDRPSRGGRSYKLPHVIFLLSPTHCAPQRLQRIAAPAMGEKDDAAKLNRVSHLIKQISGVGSAMERECVKTLALSRGIRTVGAQQSLRTALPRWIDRQPGGCVLQNRRLLYQIDRHASSQRRSPDKPVRMESDAWAISVGCSPGGDPLVFGYLHRRHAPLNANTVNVRVESGRSWIKRLSARAAGRGNDAERERGRR